MCDGATDIEESGAGFDVQAKGGIEIPGEFSLRCACVEILDRAVWKSWMQEWR